MAIVLSFIALIVVLVAGFRSAATSKHPILMRIFIIVIALALIAAIWFGIQSFITKYVHN